MISNDPAELVTADAVKERGGDGGDSNVPENNEIYILTNPQPM